MFKQVQNPEYLSLFLPAYNRTMELIELSITPDMFNEFHGSVVQYVVAEEPDLDIRLLDASHGRRELGGSIKICLPST